MGQQRRSELPANGIPRNFWTFAIDWMSNRERPNIIVGALKGWKTGPTIAARSELESHRLLTHLYLYG
jgi:hypothetical protein